MFASSESLPYAVCGLLFSLLGLALTAINARRCYEDWRKCQYRDVEGTLGAVMLVPGAVPDNALNDHAAVNGGAHDIPPLILAVQPASSASAAPSSPPPLLAAPHLYTLHQRLALLCSGFFTLSNVSMLYDYSSYGYALSASLFVLSWDFAVLQVLILALFGIVTYHSPSRFTSPRLKLGLLAFPLALLLVELLSLTLAFSLNIGAFAVIPHFVQACLVRTGILIQLYILRTLQSHSSRSAPSDPFLPVGTREAVRESVCLRFYFLPLLALKALD